MDGDYQQKIEPNDYQQVLEPDDYQHQEFQDCQQLIKDENCDKGDTGVSILQLEVSTDQPEYPQIGITLPFTNTNTNKIVCPRVY